MCVGQHVVPPVPVRICTSPLGLVVIFTTPFAVYDDAKIRLPFEEGPRSAEWPNFLLQPMQIQPVTGS